MPFHHRMTALSKHIKVRMSIWHSCWLKALANRAAVAALPTVARCAATGMSSHSRSSWRSTRLTMLPLWQAVSSPSRRSETTCSMTAERARVLTIRKEDQQGSQTGDRTHMEDNRHQRVISLVATSRVASEWMEREVHRRMLS